MIKLKIRFFSLLILSFSFLLSTTLLNAAFSNNRVWNARARGLGGAYTAIADDSGTLLYNPAGLAKINFSELYFLYADLYADLDGVDLGTNYISYIHPVKDIGTFGVNYYKFQDSELYFEDYISINYGRKIIPKLSVGLGISSLSHGYKNVDKYTLDADDPTFKDGTKAEGYGLNLGVKYSLNEYFLLGASANNINKPDLGLKSRDIVPADYRLGVAFKYNRLLIPVDLAYRDQGWGEEVHNKLAKHIGLEWKLTDYLAVRSGLNDYEISLGFSLFDKQIFANVDSGIDYSMSFPIEIEDTLGTHQVSLFFRFGYINLEIDANKQKLINYKKIHPKFSIKEGLSSFSENSADLLFEDKLVLRFYAIIKGQYPFDRAREISYQLSKIMRLQVLDKAEIEIEKYGKEQDKIRINILNTIFIPVDEDAYLINVEPDYLANEWYDNLERILIFKKSQKKEIVRKISDKIFVKGSFTAVSEIASVYVRDKKVFTFYAKGKDGESVLDKTVAFAQVMNDYVDSGIDAMSIASSTLYGDYYIIIKNRKVLYINSEAEFLGEDKKKLLVKYQDLLYEALS